jgi:uncharacterized membrane protein (DUF373 family)
MTKREIIGSVLGLIVSIGVTVLVTSIALSVPPNHPNFAALVGTVVIVFVLVEVARNLWIHKKRRSYAP